jgi:hypothetical protein
MSWSDEDFCARVVRRCEEVGRSQRAVLKEANCAHDYLQTNPTHGRRIDRIVRIAEVLDMPLASLMGLPMTGQVIIDTNLLLLAYQAAQQATQLVQRPTDEIFVETMATVYTVLMDRQNQGLDPRDAEELKRTIDVLKAGMAVRQPAARL